MITPDPILIVLGFAGLAALAAASGALPFAGHRRPHDLWIGSAYALASGLMLGSGHLLMLRGLDRLNAKALAVILGAALGVAFSHGCRVYAGLGKGDTRRQSATPLPESDRILLQNTLHAAAEGVAIGAAMAADLRLGIFTAMVLLIHNIAEAMALIDELRPRDLPLHELATLAVITKLPQPLFAVFTYALLPALEALAAALGFAAAALVFLVLTELAPAAYARAGRKAVAFLTSAAAAVVVLLENLFV